MSNPKIIVTRKQTVFMAHICSTCGFPVVSVVNMEAIAQKYYHFFSDKAECIASAAAAEAINRVIRRIESCAETKVPIGGDVRQGSLESQGSYCSFSYSGLQTMCPNCDSFEPWQAVSTVRPNARIRDLSELQDANFPIVFWDVVAAERWATAYITKLVFDIEEKRKDSHLVEQAVNDVRESLTIIRDLENEILYLPELKDRDDLMQQIQKLRDQRDGLKLFDFQGKKAINAEIKTLELQAEGLDETIKSKAEILQKSLSQEKQSLRVAQTIAFGHTRQITSKRFKNTFVFQYEPNPIPKDLLASIGRSKAVENIL